MTPPPGVPARPFASALLVGLCALASLGCESSGRGAAPRPAASDGLGAFEREVGLASDYLVASVTSTGRFVYRRHAARAGDRSEGEYNVLRHAGAIYALDAAERAAPDPQRRAALLRAARYLKEHHLRALPREGDAPRRWVIVSRPGEEVERPLAKLGGAGLGLVALCAARRHDPSLVSLDELRGLARFVTSAQQESGSFRAKLALGEDLRPEGWEPFVSLYYPGEAILGLLRLHALDPDPAWLRCAARAAAFLARSRRNLAPEDLPHDHWLLIAGAELLPRWTRLGADEPCPRALVRGHLDTLASLFLDVQARVALQGRYPGSFHTSGAVCPSATRIEGLVAYAELEPARATPSAPRRATLLAGIALGARFIAGAQHTGSGRADLAGGFPRGVLDGSPGEVRGELRVDYTQHALSALLGAQRLP